MAWTVFLIPIVALICVFTFVAVATWSDNRRKEREAYYRHETYHKMLAGGSEGAAEAVRQLIRDEESRRERRRTAALELGLKLGGMVTVAAGVGLGVFLYFLEPDDPVYVVGLIPVLVGAVLTLYGFNRSSRPPAAAAGSS